MLRPGGTVSGPTQMGLADGAAYALILAHIGPVALAVTSSLNIAFLRKPQPADLVADATFLKLGRKLAVVDVRLRSEGSDDPIAQATVTYAIPSGEWTCRSLSRALALASGLRRTVGQELRQLGVLGRAPCGGCRRASRRWWGRAARGGGCCRR